MQETELGKDEEKTTVMTNCDWTLNAFRELVIYDDKQHFQQVIV